MFSTPETSIHVWEKKPRNQSVRERGRLLGKGSYCYICLIDIASHRSPWFKTLWWLICRIQA